MTGLMTWARNSAVPGAAPFAAIAACCSYCSSEDLRSAKAPLLILIGERDDWCPAALCQRLVAGATALGCDASVTICPGATHASASTFIDS
jgi:dienelactone hydrolase